MRKELLAADFRGTRTPRRRFLRGQESRIQVLQAKKSPEFGPQGMEPSELVPQDLEFPEQYRLDQEPSELIPQDQEFPEQYRQDQEPSELIHQDQEQYRQDQEPLELIPQDQVFPEQYRLDHGALRVGSNTSWNLQRSFLSQHRSPQCWFPKSRSQICYKLICNRKSECWFLCKRNL